MQYDCMGRLTDVRYYASNKAEAMKLFKSDTVNYREYGYFGNHIDFDLYEKELMYDYFEIDGHIFKQ